ncbi:MAG: lamin tail domain-containing protein, partial [Phaeodactylibacter sp.]|nr:lamin tail domain-containing protein [Phaeodactylibacter sp.]
YVIPEAYDVLINEIMASPPDGSVPGTLPAGVEYVELYNRSTKTLNLEGWTFSDAGTPQELPAFDLAPGGLVILCDDSDVSELSPYGEVLGLSSFPALNNAGDDLSLVTAEGLLVHQVNYTDDWYRDAVKEDGGWSLELINPFAPCEGAFNWIASNDLSGGTPGIENSVYEPAPDYGGPLLVDIIYNSDLNAFDLLFSESLDLSTVLESDFLIEPLLGILQVETFLENQQLLRLYLDDLPLAGITYEIRVLNDGVADCLGNSNVGALTRVFRIAEPYDILIHEIMAFPPDPESDVLLPAVEYVELYNRTDSPVNLSGWTFFANTSDADFPAMTIEAGAYLILCRVDAVDSLSAFGPTIGLEGFPGLTNSGSTLKLLDRNGTLIHRVPYTDEWYKSTSKASGGWSLELVNPLNYCAGVANWQASADLSGGTPGQENSVTSPAPDEVGPSVQFVIPPDAPSQIEVVFSEDLDPGQAADTDAYSIDQGVEVIGVEFHSEARNRLTLLLFPELVQGTIYTLSTTTVLEDCQNNPVEVISTTRFALTDPILPGDLIINEVLFHPEVGGKDFVEVYNTTSDKIFDLNALVLANLSQDLDTS